MCPNGDLVAAYYNTLRWEDEIDQSVLTMRLRYGSDEWDMPEPWPDCTDAADAAPIFWNDSGKMWLLWGSPRMLGAAPFQFVTSTDNGATWSPAQTPILKGAVGKFTPQPVNSIVRDRDGTIYLPVDGEGADTVLFATTTTAKPGVTPADEPPGGTRRSSLARTARSSASAEKTATSTASCRARSAPTAGRRTSIQRPSSSRWPADNAPA
jgi:hypothetical protein